MSEEDFHQAMIAKKEGLIDKGYAESDFRREYWLGTSEVLEGMGFVPRVRRDQGSLVKYYRDLLQLCNREGASILDVGAGAGATVNGFREAGFTAEGCEFSSSGREVALEEFGIELKTCDLRAELPYENDEFDFSLCLGVLSMVPEKYMENALLEILRVTKYAVMVNIGTHFRELMKADLTTNNRHHITNLARATYWELFSRCGAVDITSFLPPQKNTYGIGVGSEFCGLFAKGIVSSIVNINQEDGDG